jgi:hypothetical protein
MASLALARVLEDRRLEGYQLILEGLCLIAPDERRKFVDAAIQRIEKLEQRAAGPTA